MTSNTNQPPIPKQTNPTHTLSAFKDYLQQDAEPLPSQWEQRTFGRILPKGLIGQFADEILCYWFGTHTNPQDNDYGHDGNKWFRPSQDVDQEIKTRFLEHLHLADAGTLDILKQTPHGVLALIILFDQFPRHIFRGTAKMFAYDTQALALAQQLIDQDLCHILAPAERMFVYFVLEHIEDVTLARQASLLLATLMNETQGPQKKSFVKAFRAANKHVDLLEQFGQYPYRNPLLGRTSTPAEEQYIKHTKSRFARSVKSPTQEHTETQTTESTTDEDHTNETRVQKLKLLFLHSFRQNARLMRARTKKMRKQLADIADIVYANAPLPYSPKGDIKEAVYAAFGRLRDTEHQRIWWNADEGNTQYEGVDVSLAYIEQMCKQHGPFDGIIGFSQGGALTGLVAAMEPEKALGLQFVVCISGFPSRSAQHDELLQPNSISLPSLHVVGQNGLLVDPDRTFALAHCFQTPQIIEHSGGHFVPDKWPLDEIKTFMKGFCKPYIDPAQRTLPQHADLKQKVDWFDESNAPLDILTQWYTPQQLAACQTLFKDGETSEVETLQTEDRLSIALAHKTQDTTQSLALLTAFVALGLDKVDVLLRHLAELEAWELINQWAGQLATWREQQEHTNWHTSFALIHEAIVDVYVQQIQEDRARLTTLIENEDGEYASEWPTSCATHAPRVKGALDRKTELARDIAKKLNPLHEGRQEGLQEGEDPQAYTKQICYRLYRKWIMELRNALAQLSLHYSDNQLHLRRKFNKQRNHERLHLLDEPISSAILHPEPEPVLPRPLKEFSPLFSWLANEEKPEKMEQFERGTCLPDGRLDLCKQVVGPQGIEPLLDAMDKNKYMTRLLLGNNIVGDDGAKAIADYIKSGRSVLDIWYIAGNRFTAKGLKWITEALSQDTQVRHLWLKRNPLGPDSGPLLRDLLTHNQTLEVLDVLNCGLLNDGVIEVAKGLSSNRSLRHIYLCANGVKASGAKAVADAITTSELTTLYISCNRLGDEGVRYLAEGLKHNTSIERLGLASNRISSKGARALVDALHEHPNLLHLDLGFMRGTDALGESGNVLGDEGAETIAELIASHPTLRSVDLLHNDISQRGLNALRDALRQNPRLLKLRFTQFSKAHNELVREEIKARIEQNRAMTPSLEDIEKRTLQPEYINEIYSVYRTA